MSRSSSSLSRVGSGSYHGALASPAFWIALGLLVLNDHVLKAAGILPGWLTGKLSDFAGLIVGPVVAAGLCPGRCRRLQLMAAGLVVGGFVATELSPACAAAVAQTFAWFGLRARLWPDATDLTALAVLPWTWGLLQAPRRERSPALARSGLAAAALACVATAPGDSRHHGPFLVNHTGERLRVQITWFEGPDACTAPLDVLANRVDSLSTLAQHTFELKPDWTMRLDQPTDVEEDVVGICPEHVELRLVDAGAKPPCILLRISGDQVPAQLVRSAEWTSSDPGVCAPRIPAYDGSKEGALVIGHGSDRERSVRAYEHFETFALPQP